MFGGVRMAGADVAILKSFQLLLRTKLVSHVVLDADLASIWEWL